MVDTKSRGYSNSGRLSEGQCAMPFISTRPSPTYYYEQVLAKIGDECLRQFLDGTKIEQKVGMAVASFLFTISLSH